MADYPDWQKAFNLVGSTITVNVNIEASDVTLPISIDAATVTLDVNIAAQVGNITFEFADQSVAVFDAAKWFAHEAEQIFVNAQASIAANGEALLADRTVPGTKTFYVAGYAWGTNGYLAITGTHAFLLLDAVYVAHTAGPRGGSIVFDVPIRVEAGETLELHVGNVHSASAGYQGGFWGWDEDVE